MGSTELSLISLCHCSDQVYFPKMAAAWFSAMSLYPSPIKKSSFLHSLGLGIEYGRSDAVPLQNSVLNWPSNFHLQPLGVYTPGNAPSQNTTAVLCTWEKSHVAQLTALARSLLTSRINCQDLE